MTASPEILTSSISSSKFKIFFFFLFFFLQPVYYKTLKKKFEKNLSVLLGDLLLFSDLSSFSCDYSALPNMYFTYFNCNKLSNDSQKLMFFIGKENRKISQS